MRLTINILWSKHIKLSQRWNYNKYAALKVSNEVPSHTLLYKWNWDYQLKNKFPIDDWTFKINSEWLDLFCWGYSGEKGKWAAYSTQFSSN